MVVRDQAEYSKNFRTKAWAADCPFAATNGQEFFLKNKGAKEPNHFHGRVNGVDAFIPVHPARAG